MDFQGKHGLKRAGIGRKKSFVIDVSDWESEEYFSSFVTVWSYLSKLGSRLSVAFAALCVVGLLTWCGMRPRPSIGPQWIRVDRLPGEHGIQRDNAPGRQQFERRMEAQANGILGEEPAGWAGANPIWQAAVEGFP